MIFLANMASKKIVLKPKGKLVNGKKKPCAFCMQEIDDEATLGKLYAIGDIQVHYFCVLLSCCLEQKGKDSEGLFGFLYHDIIAEVERSKKHKCSYCNKKGAAMGCSVSQCRKQFHLPCGRERNVVSLFYGSYKSFCVKHAPKQKIPEHIMAPARLRMKKARNALRAPQNFSTLKELCANNTNESCVETESVCVICSEAVDGFPGAGSFWPPCCARDVWLHRTCLQRMALSAGMHHLKCPLCNDKDQFYDAVVSQGIYVPDRDAAWELEQNAFAEIYERPSVCSAEDCRCPMGRNHDADSGEWNIQLCILCGTVGRHSSCLLSGPGMNPSGQFVCQVCAACAPADLEQLPAKVDSAEQQQQSRQNARRAVMPSRMSHRRTTARTGYNKLTFKLPRGEPSPKCSKQYEQQTQHKRPEHVCSVCARVCQTSQGLASHYRGSHLVKFTANKLACNPCGEWFPTPEEVTTHHKQHKSTNKPYQCRGCMTNYKQLQAYNQHIAESECVPWTEVPDINCEECWKRFPTCNLLQQHKCAGVDSRPGGKCNQCCRSYATLKGLKKHVCTSYKKKSNVIISPSVRSLLSPAYVRISRCDSLWSLKKHVCTSYKKKSNVIISPSVRSLLLPAYVRLSRCDSLLRNKKRCDASTVRPG